MASAIKRGYDIKDFDTFFPGHGGLMDRFVPAAGCGRSSCGPPATMKELCISSYRKLWLTVYCLCICTEWIAN